MYTKGEKQQGYKSFKTIGGVVQKKITLEDVGNYPMVEVPEYVTKRSAEYFKVRSEVSQEDGVTPVKTFFPYYNQNGKLCGYKVRDWTLDKKASGHFTALGDVSVGVKLFGQVEAESISRRRKNLVYCEGEGDVLAAFEAMMDSLAGTKFETLYPHVVGLPLGTSNAVACTATNEDFVRSFEKDEEGKIHLAFDNDSATEAEVAKGVMKGEEAKVEVAGFLMSSHTYEYQLGNFNDIREYYLNASDPKELGNLLAFGGKKYTPERIVDAGDLTFEALTKPREEGFEIKSFPELMKKTHGFRKGEMVVFTSHSGVGKTTVITEICHELIHTHKQKMGMIYLEEVVEETTLRMIARHLKVNYNSTFKFKPLAVVTEEQFKEGMEAVKGKLALVDHFGSMAVKTLIRKIKYLEHVDKCDFIVLDHLSMVFSGTATTNERKLIDELMTALAAYVANSNVGILAVSHLKRGLFEIKKDKNGDEKPTWMRVAKEDLRGSGSLEQLSWVILGIEGEILPDRERGRVRIVVLKNRAWSTLGTADTVKMDDKTGEFYDASGEEYEWVEGSTDTAGKAHATKRLAQLNF